MAPQTAGDLSSTTPGRSHQQSGRVRGAKTDRQSVEGRIGKTLLVLCRQSTPGQVAHNKGSAAVQRRVAETHSGLGFARVELFELGGESSTAGARRPVFQRFLGRAAMDDVAGIATFLVDRLGRNMPDFVALLELAKAHKLRFFEDGLEYDPADIEDEFNLGLKALIAQRDGRVLSKRLGESRFELARLEQKVAVSLPGILCWVPLHDPEYATRLVGLGREHPFGQDRLERQKIRPTLREHECIVGPVPDADAIHATELAVRWMRESKEIRVVLKRIRHDPAWPRPGQLPGIQTRIYRPGLRVQWRHVTARALRSWFESPALYGAYVYQSPAVARLRRVDLTEVTVRVDDAFPSFATPADERGFRAAVAEVHRSRDRVFAGPRNHVVPSMRCGALLDDGSVCGRKLPAVYSADGSYDYKSGDCHWRHRLACTIPKQVDDTVLEIILDLVEPTALAEAVKRIRLDASGVAHETRRLESALEQSTVSVGQASTAARDVRSRLDGLMSPQREVQELLVQHYDEVLLAVLKQREKLKSELKQHREQLAAIRAAGGPALEQLLDLSTSLPDLVGRIRAAEARGRVEGSLRALLAEFDISVYVRRLAPYVYEVRVRFPLGTEARRLAFTLKVTLPDAVGCWAAGRLHRGISPATVAREAEAAIAAVRAHRGVRRPLKHAVPWTADRVVSAALRYLRGPDAATRHRAEASLRHPRPSGPRPRTLAQLAEETGLPQEAILGAAFLGRLGPTCWRDEEFLIAPTKKQLHLRFPEYARRAVAKEQGWGESETQRLDLFAHLTHRARNSTRRIAALVGQQVAYDAFGRAYVSLRAIKQTSAEEVLRRTILAGPAEYHQLPLQWWTAISSAAARMHTSPGQLLRLVPHVRVLANAPVKTKQYVWIDPALESTVRISVRRAATQST